MEVKIQSGREEQTSSSKMNGLLESRGTFLSLCQYTPPSWAAQLGPIPSHYYALGHLPTPIHRWNLPDLPTNTEVWIKREDLSGMQLSGNKVRKLEFLMADAKAKGADCIITIGGIQSNHCRATAVAARYLNLDCYLILRTTRAEVDENPGLIGNLLVERMVGANIELISMEEHAQIGSVTPCTLLKERLEKDGRKPYVIPVGGSNSLGTCGGTTAGLSLGSHLSSLKAKVHAFSVCDDPDNFYDYTQGLLNGLHAGLNSHDLISIVNAEGIGYAMSKVEELKCVCQIAEATGVVLDPVYSGKAAFQMLRDMVENPSKWEGRKVLFIHSGGLLGMYDKMQQLQPLIGKWQRFKVDDSVLQVDGVGKMF
ncbi:putative D-cysteine desulfhydrase 1, mitochondrial isoform X3 [Cryptomeria japonica]|uniref:putative D-cysteine desulfhydrase 1, mitochondrial isoform X3 n=1 Tax=Cryptomeria japonica TaxID=3369 RepID=UPI0025ABF2DB|nr:putative D-cysteine desulfhydrase 1, mitochondrial isoform X3 [Cryptomeria japonica]